jgi:sugar lactone lactonase YvrE
VTRPPRPRRLAAALPLALCLAVACAATAAAKPRVNGTFEVKGVGVNNKIVAGPDGNMWVTVSNGADDVARITPAGKVTEFELEGVASAIGIAADRKGTMWVTYEKGVASFSVKDPKGSSKATELAGVKGAEAIVAGPQGQMWVGASELVLHFPLANPAAPTKLPVPGLASKDIDVFGKKIAVADANEPGRVVTFTTNGTEKDIKTPGGSQGLAGSPQGQIAFSAPAANPEQAGLITGNRAKSFKLVGDPFGVALGADKAFWIVLFNKGILERVTSTGVHTAGVKGLPKETARQIAAGPRNTLWVTLPDRVARITGLEPETTIAAGPKAMVKTNSARANVAFRFASTIAGSRFECAVTEAGAGAKPLFKGCKTPRTFALAPGSYTFRVRAVSAGNVDSTPARRSFRVVPAD